MGEFNNSLAKARELMAEVSNDAGIAIPSASSIEGAVEWLNESIEPFTIFLKLQQDNRLTDDQKNAIEASIKVLSVESMTLIEQQNWTSLVKTPDGQRLKRGILESLYPLKTPKSQKTNYQTSPFLLTHYTLHPSGSRSCLLKCRKSHG
jgi:hypothetical protein